MKNDDIKLFNDYSKITEKSKQAFLSNIESDVTYKVHSYKCEYDFTWLEVMEDTIRYIEKIVKEPKAFILVQEEIVPVEKSKKITVESVIHLSQHTNYISDFNPKTGDVKPTKVLNTTREETLDIYENRFIYSLINKMIMFIEKYGKLALESNSSMNNKSLVYTAKTKKDNEHINIKLNIESLEDKSTKNKEKTAKLNTRITTIRDKVHALRNSYLYKTLLSLNVPEVKSPIRKTNIILKNPNFQRAEYLWTFLEKYDKNVKKETKYVHNYSNNRAVEEKLNTSFLVDYAIFSGTEETEEDTNDINLNYLKYNIRNYLGYDTFMNEDEFIKLMKNEFKNIRSNQEKNFNEIRKLINEDLAYYKDNHNYIIDLMKKVV